MLKVLVGKDTFGRAKRVSMLVEEAGLAEVVRLDGDSRFVDWQSAIGQASLFGEMPVVVISADRLPDNDGDLVMAVRGAVHSGQLVVISIVDWPKRGPLMDILRAGKVEQFAELSQGQMVRWVMEEAERLELKLGRTMAVRLVEVFDGDRWAIWTELEKWRMAVGDGGLVGDEMLDGLEWVISGKAFRLAEAWAGRQRAESLQELEAAYARGDEVPALIGLLERQGRLMKVCQLADGSPEKLASRLGLPGFAVKKTQQQAKRWPGDQLNRALEGLFTLDWAAKTGRIEPQLGLELWMVETVE